ncbi:phenylalanine--tRNA ligase subunit beta [Hujiaoplasma nucleasis]|uniref:Phenylalanine--tRNA ligase beta subunit n=1 Tax=Hujiaoplasma nucleasis TaxID=2725268 RepID=A0A7L6N4E3_9MOLU|nr:phenylalanine--tRNA ligase subunit beta [Hujiaoplasma nucleasis]QLY39364.1 phenylalanine--tRNA ligase subunit beta [Hujiaoplasma nucleasis]
MKVSINWLKNYFNETLDPHQLKTSFNLMSQEVEALYPLVQAEHLVIGYVEKAQQHENADKLKVCQVNVGDESLQIICGAPNVDAGQKVIVALAGAVLPGNFKIKKAKIRGVESNGMICSLAELGVQDFDKSEKGIYVLDDQAPIGQDPLKYMGLDDWVLDLDLTANRADLLSMRGVAYDVKAMLDIELEIKKPQVHRKSSQAKLEIRTETKDAPIYYGQIIENIQVKDSPYWLKSRLLSAGIRPINNVVDITNYVMLEYGQPLHAFDYEKVNSQEILVRNAKEDEVILTLDETERKLLTTDIVITDGKKPIALAGVMGGFETEVDVNTKSILLESAVFNPVSVRKTSKRLNLKSESSSRYEKGINSELTKEALDRACELFELLAKGQVMGQPSYYNHMDEKNQDFYLSLEKLNTVTGHHFTIKEVEDILRRLDFEYKRKDKEFSVKIPARRLGFDSYQDIIEEIVRIYGYDKIGTSLPLTPSQGRLTKKQMFKREIRQLFTSLGFHETNTYSLTNLESAQKYDREPISLVKIMNPLNKDREYLRHSTLPALTEVFSYNHARKISDIFLFEIGKRYSQENELELLSGLMHGNYMGSLWQKQMNPVDFYLIKGLIERFFQDLKISNIDYRLSNKMIPNLHPGISAEIYIENQYCGFIGKLHPEEEKVLDAKDIYVFELELDVIYASHEKQVKSFEPISKYPSVSRDIALLVDQIIPAKNLIDTVYQISNNSLKTVQVFDVYQGQHLENGKKSVALQLIFENNEKTLETEEVDQMVKRIIKALAEKHQAVLRQ